MFHLLDEIAWAAAKAKAGWDMYGSNRQIARDYLECCQSSLGVIKIITVVSVQNDQSCYNFSDDRGTQV